MENFQQNFQCTLSNLFDFIVFTFLLQSMWLFGAGKCLKMKFLIDVWTVLCKIWTLCRVDLTEGQVG